VPGEPRREQRGDYLPVPVAVAFVGEVRVERLFQPAERLGEPGDPGQVREVPRGEGHDHDGVATVRSEIPRETAVEMVGDTGTAVAGEPRFGEKAEVAGDGERHVRQRQGDRPALPGAA